MGDRSGIEWLKDERGGKGATWNPIRAREKKTGKIGWHCERVSPGCVPCYAEAMNAWRGTGRAFTPANRRRVEIFLDEAMLTRPVSWTKPRRIFPCSMTDLFADFVLQDWLDEMAAVMALAPWHTFIITTKRGDRMREYFLERPRHRIYDAAERISERRTGRRSIGTGEWPLRNVLLGVSVEDQRRADERHPALADLARAGWFTWVSYEPALGPVDWQRWEFLDWMVSGGQSGRGAAPSHPGWHRVTRDFCARHGIPYHFKQWGEFAPTQEFGGELDAAGFERVGKHKAGRLLDGVEHDGFPKLGAPRHAA
jgi:protein gp37